MHFKMPTNLVDDALYLLKKGWYVVPLCWPDSFGRCACGKNRWHVNREGKVPLITGYQQERADEKSVRRWWRRWPQANVGVLLEPSELLVVDADGEAAVEEVLSLGLPETLTVKTPKGYHWYFARPDKWPVTRITQQGESKGIDILAKLFTVAPASFHRSGAHYYWETAPDHELAEPPPWVRKLLPPPSWFIDPNTMPKRRTGQSFDETYTTYDKLKSALGAIEADDYDLWLKVGMALKVWDEQGNGEGKGFQLWDEWSKSSGKYPGIKRLSIKWGSFGRSNGLGLGTIYAKAKAAGWNFDPYTTGLTRSTGSFYSS